MELPLSLAVRGKSLKSVMGDKDKEKLIRRLKDTGVVKREQVVLKHAGTSALYIDIKKVYGYPDILAILVELIRGHISKEVNCIAACGYGGLPLAGALAIKHKLHLVLVREESKKHGRNVWIDGYAPKSGDKIWIVDDVFTTGGSIKHIMRILKPTGVKVIGCSVVVKRTNKKIPIQCKYILFINDLL